MAFTIEDLTDLKRLLVTHPEWQAELREMVLTDKLLTLPMVVHELAEAQARTERRVGELAEAQARTERRVEELTEAQRRTEERLDTFEERLDALVVQMGALVEAQIRTEEAVRMLVEEQKRMREHVASLLGFRLEQQYAQRAAAYFGQRLRRIRLVLPGALDAATEDRLEANLTHEELLEVLRLDAVVVGQLRQVPVTEEAEVWLAVEVSVVIDRHDVERAHRRAALLQKAGCRAIPVVAGEGLTQGATALLQKVPVVMVLDGRSQGWDEALAEGIR